MARSTEKVALKFMKALAVEHQENPDVRNCRPAKIIAEGICKSQAEFDCVIEFIGPRLGLIKAWHSSDGLIAVPNEKGFAWIESHIERWTLDRRIAVLAIIVSALIAVLIALWLK